MDNITVAFDMDRCHMELNYPYALKTMTLANLKKVFVIMCTQGYRNTEAIRITEQYIQELIPEAKAEWHKASVDYQNGYRDTKFVALSKWEKESIEKQNKKLLRVVASKKKAYERCLKMLDYFTNTKVKYGID